MKLFEIKNKVVVINENVLLIPEFKALMDKYENPLPALCFVYYSTDPHSPYLNEPEQTRDAAIYKDFPGEYRLVDSELEEAVRKATTFYESATERFFRANQTAIDKMSIYLETTQIDDSKETGNITHFRGLMEKCGKIIDEFEKLKKKREEELKKARGKGRTGYDI